LSHLPKELSETPEDSDETTLELVSELQKSIIIKLNPTIEYRIRTLQISEKDAPRHHCTTASMSSTLNEET